MLEMAKKFHFFAVIIQFSDGFRPTDKRIKGDCRFRNEVLCPVFNTKRELFIKHEKKAIIFVFKCLPQWALKQKRGTRKQSFNEKYDCYYENWLKAINYAYTLADTFVFLDGSLWVGNYFQLGHSTKING